MVCIYRPMGGNHGFNNTEWLSDNLIPVVLVKSDVLTVTCQYRHLSEFAVIQVPTVPTEITTRPSTPSPDFTTTFPTTEIPQTQVSTTQPPPKITTAPSEPSTGKPGASGTPVWIAAVAVLLVVVTVVIIVLGYFFYYKKHRMAKMTVVPENIELANSRGSLGEGMDDVDGKGSMQVINVDQTGDRREVCTVRILKTIRLRELRNVLIDEFGNDFKDKPFYFLTRHLKEVEPEDETMQFVRVVYEGEEIFVREVKLDQSDATRLHFCTCGSVAQFECAECQSQGYCSPDCQRKHWVEVHIKECRTLGEKKRRTAVLSRSRQTSVNQLPGTSGDQVGSRPQPRYDVKTWRGYLNRTISGPVQPSVALPHVRSPARYSVTAAPPTAFTAAVGSGFSRAPQNSYRPPPRASGILTSARGSVASDGSFQPPVANFPKPSFDQEVPEGTPMFDKTKGQQSALSMATEDSPSRTSLSRGLNARPGTTIGSPLEDVKEEETGQDGNGKTGGSVEGKTDSQMKEPVDGQALIKKIDNRQIESPTVDLSGLTESAV